ncbi:MAG TPA: hypothetical protein EYQ24_02535 [Bacteroidetes bacterium]|nr:hypothetical protein [Bacteroidota bacterium]HIL56882.1 hypothetical protein [Rhodothermales bacterium]
MSALGLTRWLLLALLFPLTAAAQDKNPSTATALGAAWLYGVTDAPEAAHRTNRRQASVTATPTASGARVHSPSRCSGRLAVRLGER